MTKDFRGRSRACRVSGFTSDVLRAMRQAGVGLLALAIVQTGAAAATSGAPSAEARIEFRPNLLGAVALPIKRTPFDARWLAVRNSKLSLGPQEQALMNRVRKLPIVDRIEAVNAWVNGNIKFVSDARQSGRSDSWSDPAGTLRRRNGDCEDVAILKRQLLQMAGVPTTRIFLSIVRDLVRKADHAVLIVHANEDAFLLDNSTDELLDAAKGNDYRPIFTLGDRGQWLYGYQRSNGPIS
jgi:predicted transglutaminase-like cysteine proteinase